MEVRAPGGKATAMDETVKELLKQKDGLSFGYRFFWRLQYTTLGFFGPPDYGSGGGPRGELIRSRTAKVEQIRSAKREPGAAE